MQQQHLPFPEVPRPSQHRWQQLDDKQRKMAIEILARLIARAALPTKLEKESGDE